MLNAIYHRTTNAQIYDLVGCFPNVIVAKLVAEKLVEHLSGELVVVEVKNGICNLPEHVDEINNAK